MGFTILRRGSEKGVSRKVPRTPLGEYAPSGVHPIQATSSYSKRAKQGLRRSQVGPIEPNVPPNTQVPKKPWLHGGTPNCPRMQLCGFQLEASCLQWGFSTYSCVWELLCLQLELFLLIIRVFFAYGWSFMLTVEAFFAYSEKALLISSSTDCKQKSSNCQ